MGLCHSLHLPACQVVSRLLSGLEQIAHISRGHIISQRIIEKRSAQTPFAFRGIPFFFFYASRRRRRRCFTGVFENVLTEEQWIKLIPES